MNTKSCETCGKPLIGVKGDRRFCNACATPVRCVGGKRIRNSIGRTGRNANARQALTER